MAARSNFTRQREARPTGYKAMFRGILHLTVPSFQIILLNGLLLVQYFSLPVFY